jgi:hypothetical protein
MKRNTLQFTQEHWDDPGDYPSGAGGYPLPSYVDVVVEGELVLDPGEVPDDFVPYGYVVCEWHRDGDTYTVVRAYVEDSDAC